jgi:hypothetical protein
MLGYVSELLRGLEHPVLGGVLHAELDKRYFQLGQNVGNILISSEGVGEYRV